MQIAMNAELGEALAYLSQPYSQISQPENINTYKEQNPHDRFWRWRYSMSERIAASLDPERFGVKSIYLFGSTNYGTAGPGSDIDLIVHFGGTEQQKNDLTQWLEGWSLCLAEINYLKTGYKLDGLLDIHIITDEDFVKNTVFASMVRSSTEPVQPLKMNKEML